MPSKTTGTLIQNADKTFSARVTLQKQRPLFPLTHCRSDEAALERLAQLATLAKQMTTARCDFDEAKHGLQKVADARPGKTLRDACADVDDLIGGWRPRIANMPTLDELERRWHDEGAIDSLVNEYGDEHGIKPRADSSRTAARSNYNLYIRPLLGHLPVDEITLGRCNEVKRKVRATKTLKRVDSRRQALQPLKTLLELCVHPLELLERSPLPAKWLPKKEGPRTLQWMYPDEDRCLMACPLVPVWGRALVGYLNREGGRIQETLDATLDHFDLQRGVARLDAHMTKTRKDRSWVMDPGSRLALIAWRELRRASAPGDALMFVDDEGKPIDKHGLPALLREWLQLALKAARGTPLECVTRRELFVETDTSRWLCIHDCRATCATVKLAIGMPSKLVRQRTGHKTDDQLSVYDRTVQTFRALSMGDFTPLHLAIPELSQRCVSEKQKPLETQHAPSYIVKQHASAQAPDIAGFSQKPEGARAQLHAAVNTDDASQTLRVLELESELELLRAALARLQLAARASSDDDDDSSARTQLRARSGARERAQSADEQRRALDD